MMQSGLTTGSGFVSGNAVRSLRIATGSLMVQRAILARRLLAKAFSSASRSGTTDRDQFPAQ
jgi:hypothetical protein